MGIIRDNISKNITKFRKKAGLSQKQLAEKLNIKPSRVSNWEQGANTPDIEILFELCKVFKISIDEMYGCNKEYPNIAKEAEDYETFLKRLERLGYSVDYNPIILESHIEEMKDDNGIVVGTSKIVDDEKPEWDITGNGITVKLYEDDVKQLMTSSSDLINAFLWRKSQQQK